MIAAARPPQPPGGAQPRHWHRDPAAGAAAGAGAPSSAWSARTYLRRATTLDEANVWGTGAFHFHSMLLDNADETVIEARSLLREWVESAGDTTGGPNDDDGFGDLRGAGGARSQLRRMIEDAVRPEYEKDDCVASQGLRTPSHNDVRVSMKAREQLARERRAQMEALRRDKAATKLREKEERAERERALREQKKRKLEADLLEKRRIDAELERARLELSLEMETIRAAELAVREAESRMREDEKRQLETHAMLAEDEIRQRQEQDRRRQAVALKVAEFISVHRLKLLQRAIGGWRSVILERKLTLQKHNTVETFKRTFCFWNQWKLKFKKHRTKREAEESARLMKRINALEIKAEKAHKNSTTSRLFILWRLKAKMQSEMRALREQHEQRSHIMHEFLHTLSRRLHNDSSTAACSPAKSARSEFDIITEPLSLRLRFDPATGDDGSKQGSSAAAAAAATPPAATTRASPIKGDANPSATTRASPIKGDAISSATTRTSPIKGDANPSATRPHAIEPAAAAKASPSLKRAPSRDLAAAPAPDATKSNTAAKAVVPKPFAGMEHREEERRKRKEELDRRKRENAEAEERKKAEEAARKVAEEQALKLQKIEQIRLERQRQAELEERKKMEHSRAIEMQALASKHYMASLLRFRGMLPWRRFIDAGKRGLEAAADRHRKASLARTLTRWHAVFEARTAARMLHADRHHAQALQKRTVAVWRERAIRIADGLVVAERACNHQQARAVFSRWRESYRIHRVDRLAREKEREAKADALARRLVPRRVLREWKRFVVLAKEERYRTFRREQLRSKIKLWLIDSPLDRVQDEAPQPSADDPLACGGDRPGDDAAPPGDGGIPHAIEYQ